MVTMGLTYILMCLMVGCKSQRDYLTSRYDIVSNGESSESIYNPRPESSETYYQPSKPLRPLSLSSAAIKPVGFYSWSRYLNGYKSGIPGHDKPSFINHYPAYDNKMMVINSFGHRPSKSSPSKLSSLKPKYVAESLPTSYDGASLSDTNPLIHYDQHRPASFGRAAGPSSGSYERSVDNSPSTAAAAESSSDHSSEDDSQESAEHDYSIENKQSSTNY